MKKLALGIVVAVVLIGGAAWLVNAITGEPSLRYVQIDNDHFEALENDGMGFQYRLTTFDEQGKSEETIFKTTRMLRNGAFLKLDTLPLRGVISWEEVAYEDLPDAVQQRYLEPTR